MAVIVSAEHSPENPPNNHSKPSSLSKLVKKLRHLRRSTSKKQNSDTSRQISYYDPRPPLIPTSLPLVLPEHKHTLANLGWTTLTFPSPSTPTSTSQDSSPPPSSPHPLETATFALYTAAQQFFNQPLSAKQVWKHDLGTEEGWSIVEGEKEFITLRTLSGTPEILRDAAERYWSVVLGGREGVLRGVLRGVEGSLGLGREETGNSSPTAEKSPLLNFLPPTPSMPRTEDEKTASMIRIFRYTLSSPSPITASSLPSEHIPSPPSDEQEDGIKVISEPHSDLGLLSLVTGDVPGLEVYNGERFLDIERFYAHSSPPPPSSSSIQRMGSGKATVLIGRHLSLLTNGRYPPGGHRVVSYHDSPLLPTPAQPSTEAESKDGGQGTEYRHSIIFVLRAHSPVPVISRELESDRTGKWETPVEEKDGVTAGDVYENIRKGCWNVNLGKTEREKQRRDLEEEKVGGKEGEGGLGGKLG
ncbi:unnamed protein product [Periconia digitata]|uniref:Uncharacterized protein n=1 Tax=Periconia digitata TaxID=1303443 RepID=A0A9W4U7I0_9PLEO|nr:unnamed protein product [Periconia digitata]